MLRTFGLIGYPLSHSFSKKFFSTKFENEHISGCSYELYPIESVDRIRRLTIQHSSLCGLNVTIPHKVTVIPFLDELDDAAAQIGAVNCIAIERRGDEIFLKGYNTDAFGFAESLKPMLTIRHKKALIFGDGGAAKAVKYVMKQLSIPYLVVNRRKAQNALTYEDVSAGLLKDYLILVNTTPLGMSPHTESYPPIPYEHLTSGHLAYDLVYNPEETVFLREARLRGASVKNGLEMLHLQAERSWEIWNL